MKALVSSLASLLLLSFPASLLAADPAESSPPAAAQPAAPLKGDAKVPYHGKVSAIDPAAKTFSIKGKDKERIFNITERTKITRDGLIADLSAISLGEEVRGQASRNTDKWDAVSVMMGAKIEAPKVKKATAKPVEAAPEAKN